MVALIDLVACGPPEITCPHERIGEPQSEPESTLKEVEAVNKHYKHRLCFFGCGGEGRGECLLYAGG